MNAKSGLFAVLFLLGATWGLTIPLTKIAVSTGHPIFGLVFWQAVIAVVLLTAFNLARRQRIDLSLRRWPFFLLVALTGTVIPNAVFYTAAAHLPAGVMSITIALVPMFSLPIALWLRLEPFQVRRVTGIAVGAVAVIMIIGPDTSLPDPAMTGFVLLAIIAPISYAAEGNFVAKIGLDGLDPSQLLLGASVVAVILVAPVVLVTDQWIDVRFVWGAAEWAFVASAVLHIFAYAGYIWLIDRAGSVFAAQTAYLVTGLGVVWSIALLSESYSLWVWGALAVTMLGLYLVQPRSNQPLEAAPVMGDTDP